MKPKLRFNGFEGEWEERRLSDIVRFYNGLTYSPNNIRKKGTLVLRSSNVQNGEISLTDNVFVEPSVVNCSNVQKGDIIVVVRNGSRALIGKHAQIKDDMDNTVIGAFMTGIRSDNPGFINALLGSPRFDYEVGINMGATINQITNATFSVMSFGIPMQSEQESIASFFTTLDAQISACTSRLASLKQIKAASLQAMFPQEGETVPKLRFKGFEGEWVKCILGSSSFMTAGGTPSTFIDKFWDGDINWLQSGAVHNCIIYHSSVERTITLEGLHNSSAHLIKKDSVLIAITGATCANVGYLTFESSANQSVVSVEPNSELYSKFIYQSLKVNRTQILSFKGGSAQSGVTLNNLKKLSILCPSYKEQKQIGDYFFSLETQIELQAQRLEKLKQIKSACLDNMFV